MYMIGPAGRDLVYFENHGRIAQNCMLGMYTPWWLEYIWENVLSKSLIKRRRKVAEEIHRLQSRPRECEAHLLRALSVGWCCLVPARLTGLNHY